MAQNIFSAMELDAIGEMMNISLGSSATAVSNLLDHRVDITTPKVTVVPISEFTLGELEPAIGVEIKYVSGLEGSNIMLLKRSDVKAIVELLMGTEIPEEEFELNELTISAVCEPPLLCPIFWGVRSISQRPRLSRWMIWRRSKGSASTAKPGCWWRCTLSWK